MKIQQQIGVILDIIHDLVENDTATKDEKVAAIINAIECNDRLGDAFGEFMSWFKMEDNDAS